MQNNATVEPRGLTKKVVEEEEKEEKRRDKNHQADRGLILTISFLISLGKRDMEHVDYDGAEQACRVDKQCSVYPELDTLQT